MTIPADPTLLINILANPMVLLATSLPTFTEHETRDKASRQAHRWIHRGVIQWAAILDPATGATLARYVRRAGGRVERMQ